jgi:hypothetical protein
MLACSARHQDATPARQPAESLLDHKAISAAGDAAKLQVTRAGFGRRRERPAAACAGSHDVTVAEINIVVDVAMQQPPKEERDRLRRGTAEVMVVCEPDEC